MKIYDNMELISVIEKKLIPMHSVNNPLEIKSIERNIWEQFNYKTHKTFLKKLFNACYKNSLAASISLFLVLVSFSFPIGAIIRYALVFLAFGISCGQSFRVRERYREETQKPCYPFVSFIPLVLLVIFLLTGAVYYLILIVAGIVFLFDLVRVCIMEKRMTKDDDSDDDLGSFKKP